MMFDLIVATTVCGGIALAGRFPWSPGLAARRDMQWFVKRTMSAGVVIMGRVTWDSIPAKFKPLNRRKTIVITRTICNGSPPENDSRLHVFYEKSFDRALRLAKILNPCGVPIICGGAQIYSIALKHPQLRYCYVTIISGDYDHDLEFPDYDTLSSMSYDLRTNALEDDPNQYRRYDMRNHDEMAYIGLLKKLRACGVPTPDRTSVGEAFVLVGQQLRFRLTDEKGCRILPLLTTKRVNLRGIVNELAWFLRGDTDVKFLQERDTRIWDGNTTREALDGRGLTQAEPGHVGPIYGWQWRNWGGDQIKQLIEGLRADPFGRRHVVSAWNVDMLPQMALPPCHLMFQMVAVCRPRGSQPDAHHLSCIVTMRSADTFLGVPWNIASYAILTHAIAKLVDMRADELIINMGNCHLYANHIEQAVLQSSRTARRFPLFDFDSRLATIDDFATMTVSDIIIDTARHYLPHPAISGELAV